MSSEDTFNLLCQTLRQARGNPNHKPVFWLGAGCSRYDGVPANDELLSLTVPVSAGLSWGSRQYQFDRFCENNSQGIDRADYLKPFFDRPLKSDSPYLSLARLAQSGATNLICTFNIDSLLEDSFNALGMQQGRDYKVIDGALYKPEAVADQINTNTPAIRILKLHGSHASGFNLMTSSEIAEYGPHIASVVEKCSRQTAVVCGYSFFHLNVLNAFSRDGGPLYYINSSFPDAPMVLSLMELRSRRPNFIDGDLGCFERFMPRLCAQVM